MPVEGQTQPGLSNKPNGSAARKPTYEELLARLSQLEAEKNAKIRYKVGDKKTLLMLGVRKFPLGYYKQEWEAIIEQVKSGKLEEALRQYDSELSQGKPEE